MSAVETLPTDTLPLEEEFNYQPLSTAAIAALVFGLLSPLVFVAGKDSLQWCLTLCPIPVIGALLGAKALRTMRAEPSHYSGKTFASAGLALSLACLIGGVTFSGYVYATEVPDGYERTSFLAFRPDEVDERGGKAVPPRIAELEGKRVFIKGYIRPDSTPYRKNIADFLLVRDSNECCFGDISKIKYYDQMQVKMTGDLRTDYATGVFRMGGTLRLQPENARRGPGQPVYTLEADYCK
ncbi:MAG: DUF4190 domain-containing protein [Planctomycetota bacterium]